MSAGPVSVRCPAKINLYLRVLARRPDGYHELDTVFQAVDLFDRLEIHDSPGLSLTSDDPDLDCGEGNLIVKAARLLAAHASHRAGARIHLHKAIPVGGGLGGGSSDAAGTLLGCARLWGLEASRGTLTHLAGQLGADVPFFLTGGTARGTGRGDRIQVLGDLPSRAVLLGCPPFGCPTSEVFSALADQLTLPRNGVSVPVHLTHKWPEENDFALLGNDLERVVFRRWPRLERFRDALLDAGARRAVLSGSGSTVYGIFAENDQRVAAAGVLGKRFGDWRLIPAQTVATGVELTVAGPT